MNIKMARFVEYMYNWYKLTNDETLFSSEASLVLETLKMPNGVYLLFLVASPATATFSLTSSPTMQTCGSFTCGSLVRDAIQVGLAFDFKGCGVLNSTTPARRSPGCLGAVADVVRPCLGHEDNFSGFHCLLQALMSFHPSAETCQTDENACEALSEVFWGILMARTISCPPLTMVREGMASTTINTITTINTNIGGITINTNIDASVTNTVNNICNTCSVCCSGNEDSGHGVGTGSFSHVDVSIGLPIGGAPNIPTFGPGWPF